MSIVQWVVFIGHFHTFVIVLFEEPIHGVSQTSYSGKIRHKEMLISFECKAQYVEQPLLFAYPFRP